LAELQQVTDHEEQAYNLLLEQYLEKPRIAALLASYSQEVQELEDAIWGVRIGRMLDDAEGVQLDVIGRLVGLLREGRADNVYRVLLAGKIRVNWSHGHPDDVIAVVRLVQGTENSHRYLDVYPASLEVIFQDDFVETDRGFVAPELARLVAQLVRQARSAGVHSMVLAVNEGETPMQMAYGDGDLLEPGAGMVYTDGDLDGGFPAGCYT
jgi:hypothetical protein